MSTETLFLNRVVVFVFAVIYWAGVWVQARRVRRRIGRSPNVRPKGLKETLLWFGWFLVVLAWLAVPFLTGSGLGSRWAAVIPALAHPAGLALGILMMMLGYAGTLWCYVAMGSAWRMGVNRTEKTQLVTAGPYRFVRHPIYLFQAVMVAAIVVLLPSAISLFILVIHVLCVRTKAADEDAFLQTVQSQDYQTYRARTGGWFPRWSGKHTQTAALRAAKPDPARPAGRDAK